MTDETKPEKPETPETPDLTQTRTGIQLMLAPAIETALKSSGLDMADPNILRRYFRALVHLGITRLLDLGAPPEFLATQMLEALGHEMESRAKQAATADGSPTQPPAGMKN